MDQLFLVQVGRTVWEEENRLDSLAGSPLCEDDANLADVVARELSSKGVTMIFAPGGLAEKEAAEKIARSASVPVYEDNDLSEIDYGLWQGLKIEEVKRRQPRLRKQWIESPSGVRPPGGETLLEVQNRAWNAVASIVRKNKNEVVAIVMRPIVLGLLRCRMANALIDEIWDHVRPEPGWTRVAVNFDGKDVILMEKDENG